VDHVRIEGARGVPAGDIEDKIATTASPKFLELFRGIVYDYEIFDRYVLASDLARIERFYRTRGYYEAHARVARVVQQKNHVSVTIVVEEGPPTLVGSIRVDGLDAVPKRVRDLAMAAMRQSIRQGERFDEDHFKNGDAVITHALTDHGFAYANVDRKADVDVIKHTADVVYVATPDSPATYGKVWIEGLGPLPESKVRGALQIREGKPYSRSELASAEQAALDLGVFSSVEITPDLPKPPPADHVVPIHVKLHVTRLRGVRLGGGFELDVIKTDLHVLAGWEDKNFLGGMRHFTIETRPGVVLFPTRLQDLVAPTSLLPEERTVIRFHQPGFLEGRTGGIAQAEFNIGPILLSPNPPSSPVLGYREAKGAVGVDRVFGKFYAKLTQNIQDEYPFAYIGSVDPALSEVIISYPELVTTLDYRNDRVHPHSGFYLSDTLQVAGDGGMARDVRVLPEARGYIPLAKGVTLAGRGSLGFLFPFNYGKEQTAVLLPPNPTDADRAAHAAWVKDAQVVFFRGFFSGGPSSNRGYPLFGVGPHGPAPFYNPSVSSQQVANGCSITSGATPSPQCYVPLGGSTLWEASVEFRFHVAGPFEVATFCDASDVSSQRVDIRLDRPHLSCGAGARYETPVGPVRLDVGYRIPGAQYPGYGNPQVDSLEGIPGTILGVPIAIAFGIGESY
jgi:outer membrane protein insertion porin family/translocation and assembly module TamA